MRRKKDIMNETETKIKKTIGNNIRMVRRKSHSILSVEEVAKKLEISRSNLSHIENGRNHINAVTLWKLACILGCQIGDFFPPVPDGFSLSNKDLEAIEKEGGEFAINFAKILFPKKEQ